MDNINSTPYEVDEIGNFPKTRRDSEQGTGPVIIGPQGRIAGPGVGIIKNMSEAAPERSNAEAILVELHEQSRYLRNVNRLVNFVWFCLITAAACVVLGVTIWIIAGSAIR